MQARCAGGCPTRVARRTRTWIGVRCHASCDGTSHLFLSWNHTHLDARGLDLLLNHLNGTNPRRISHPSKSHQPKQLGWNRLGGGPMSRRREARSSGCMNRAVNRFSAWCRQADARRNAGIIIVSFISPGKKPPRLTRAVSSLTAGSGAAIFISPPPSAPCTAWPLSAETRMGLLDSGAARHTQARCQRTIFSNHLSILFYRSNPNSPAAWATSWAN